MTSFFNKWSAYDIVGPLNKKEVRAVLLDYGIERKHFRTWDTIEEMLMSSSDVVKDVVYRTAMAKKKVEEQREMDVYKRRLDDQNFQRSVRRRIVGNERERDFSDFLMVPNAEEERHCYEAFYESTSNKALTFEICPVCAREMLTKEGERSILLSDPSVVDVLTTKSTNTEGEDATVILRDMLEIDEGTVTSWMCFDCIRSLERQTLPKLSLANNLSIGDIPPQLLGLTVPEQLLIARHYPRCYIFKLFPRDLDVHVPLDQLYTGMAGNASLFELNTEEVVEMLKGQRMPSPVRTLASIIAITFVSTKTLPIDWLKKTFRVRRKIVYDALLWLQSHNPIYADIHIDNVRLEELPLDDVPDELLAVVRQEEDDEAAEKEKESYLAGEVIDDAKSQNENINKENEEDCDANAHVIPIQYIGVQDCQQAKMSTNEVLLYALANADDDRYGHEGGYAVIHGAQPVPDLPGATKSFDALAGAYPSLWPYGRGLFHQDRPRKIGFQEYIRWTLQYFDKRFRKHHSFPFVAFSIQQKQSALLSAKIHMRRDDFEADTNLLANLTLRDLQEAQVDEEAHRAIENERVQHLRRHLYATSSHIMGSNRMRGSYRSQIWGTCLWLRPPSLWMTINPMDYEDPIAQIFAGETIDMDSFMDVMGPDTRERARNMANDPFASASFFNFIIRTTLETLLGIRVLKRHIESEMGIFGVVNGYFGVIEAQGRGSLHVHMLIWLKNAPNADEMLELLTQTEFREKIAKFIDHNIRNHLDGFDEDFVKHSERDAHTSFSRPPDPRSENWKEEVKASEWKLARAHQVHICKRSTCLRRNIKGELVCKRRAPWPLVERTIVHATGVLDIRRSYGFLNGYCPSILICLRCNNDIKMVIYGEETKTIGGYLTNYQTKDSSKSYNMSALLGRALTYHQSHASRFESLREQNRLLIYRCFNVLNREAELSGPQVMSYLMTWSDRFISHQYVSVYWCQLAYVLKKVYPSLVQKGDTRENEPEVEERGGNENEIMTLLGNAEGKLHVQRQVEDYILRGPEFEEMGFLTFLVETYDRRITMEEKTLVDEGNQHSISSNENSRYLPDHPQRNSHIRVCRQENHNFLPNVVGPWFPRRDGEENSKPYYYAAMLSLLKPWRNLRALKNDCETWEDAFNQFIETADQRDKDVVSGSQYYYESKNITANRETDVEREVGEGDHHEYGKENEFENDEDELMVQTTTVSDEDVVRYENMQRRDKEYTHGQLAVEAARLCGILPECNTTWRVEEEEDVHLASRDVDKKLETWQHRLQESAVVSDPLDYDVGSNNIATTSEGRVVPLSDLWDQQKDKNEMKGSIDENERIMAINVDKLSTDQRRAYDIVDWHLNQTLDGRMPPQLLMLIPGEGGVGKTKLIQTITQNFIQHDVGIWLVKGAYTGIAASLIDGKTLHVLGGIPIRGGKQSAQTLKKLRDFWRTKHYLIIDELSMLSRSFFAKLGEVISKAMEKENDKAFGGLNILLVGDFHQFPPVVARQSAPLYWPVNITHDSEDDVLGRKIYEQFTTIVQLKKQIRVQDHVWHDVLQHVRYGNCRQEHIDVIKQLIITNPNCPRTDFNNSSWKDAKLVTPRHAVRTQWNSAAIKKHCAKTHHRLYICPSEDTVGGRPVTNDEKIAIMTGQKGSKSHMDRGGLTKEIELAIGAPVMVTLNILTDLDVANGVRGIIEGIVLDEREHLITTKDSHSIRLRYPPRYVLVKLNRTKAPTLEGLEENVIPIVPVKKTFTINKNGTKITVNRTQLPLTLAYAFTDYRSQGQTLEPIIVDIGPPPYGHLTPFNIYVALSRGTGRDNIRLLRDFDENLLQQHPSEYLRLEDERLHALNESTKQMWDARRI